MNKGWYLLIISTHEDSNKAEIKGFFNGKRWTLTSIGTSEGLIIHSWKSTQHG